MTLLFHAGGTPTLPSIAALKGARASCPPEPGPACTHRKSKHKKNICRLLPPVHRRGRLCAQDALYCKGRLYAQEFYIELQMSLKLAFGFAAQAHKPIQGVRMAGEMQMDKACQDAAVQGLKTFICLRLIVLPATFVD